MLILIPVSNPGSIVSMLESCDGARARDSLVSRARSFIYGEAEGLDILRCDNAGMFAGLIRFVNCVQIR